MFGVAPQPRGLRVAGHDDPVVAAVACRLRQPVQHSFGISISFVDGAPAPLGWQPSWRVRLRPSPRADPLKLTPRRSQRARLAGQDEPVVAELSVLITNEVDSDTYFSLLSLSEPGTYQMSRFKCETRAQIRRAWGSERSPVACPVPRPWPPVYRRALDCSCARPVQCLPTGIRRPYREPVQRLIATSRVRSALRTRNADAGMPASMYGVDPPPPIWCSATVTTVAANRLTGKPPILCDQFTLSVGQISLTRTIEGDEGLRRPALRLWPWRRPSAWGRSGRANRRNLLPRGIGEQLRYIGRDQLTGMPPRSTTASSPPSNAMSSVTARTSARRCPRRPPRASTWHPLPSLGWA
jgi:hypothetical protein